MNSLVLVFIITLSGSRKLNVGNRLFLLSHNLRTKHSFFQTQVYYHTVA